MDARMSRAEPRQYFIGDGAGIARDAGERLRRTEQFDEIALGEIIFGQRADVDGQAVHRYAPDDRQPCAAMPGGPAAAQAARSEEHTSELQSLMRISYAVFCLKKKNKQQQKTNNYKQHKI